MDRVSFASLFLKTKQIKMCKLFIVFFSFYSINLIAQQQKISAVYPFGKAEKWGVINSEKEIVKKPKYDSIGFFTNIDRPGNSAVLKKNDKLGLINTKGKIILKPKYDEITTAGYRGREYQKIRKGNSWGLANRTTGKIKLKCEYEAIGEFEGKENPSTVVKKNGKFGVYGLEKGFLTAIEYDNILAYDDWETAAFELKKGGQISFIDNDGNTHESFPLEEDMPEFMDMEIEEEAPAMDPSVEIRKLEDQKFAIMFLYDMRAPQGYKRYKDTIVGYDKVLKVNVAADRHFSNSNLPVFHVVVEKDGEKGMLGKNGEVMTPAEYDSFEKSKTSSEYMYLIKGGLKGVANRYTGMRVLEAEFTEIKLNRRGLFFVIHQNGYFGYANSRGEVFLPEN
jgi:hypothetical protein